MAETKTDIDAACSTLCADVDEAFAEFQVAEKTREIPYDELQQLRQLVAFNSSVVRVHRELVDSTVETLSDVASHLEATIRKKQGTATLEDYWRVTRVRRIASLLKRETD